MPNRTCIIQEQSEYFSAQCTRWFANVTLGSYKIVGILGAWPPCPLNQHNRHSQCAAETYTNVVSIDVRRRRVVCRWRQHNARTLICTTTDHSNWWRHCVQNEIIISLDGSERYSRPASTSLCWQLTAKFSQLTSHCVGGVLRRRPRAAAIKGWI